MATRLQLWEEHGEACKKARAELHSVPEPAEKDFQKYGDALTEAWRVYSEKVEEHTAKGDK